MEQTAVLRTSKKHGFLWITLPESITMDNYGRIESRLEEEIREKQLRVVLDLASISSLYSSGLGLLIRLRSRINELGGALFLVNASRKISILLESVNLERLFSIYATDVEFEISQEEILSEKLKPANVGFVFVARIEDGIFRITMSGALAAGQDLTAFSAFEPDREIKRYVFDLTGLETIDTSGISVLARQFVIIRDLGGVAVTYGGDEFVKELLELLSLNDFVTWCTDEREAMTAVGGG
jgi:anti-anti-sigma factor